MALTKVTKSGINNNAIDADKLEDGTILAADITPGTITADKLDSTLNLSSKTVTLPNTSVTNAMLAGSIANAKLANSSLTINGSSVSLGSSISAGALDWQAVITADGSTGTTGVAGRGYFIDTTSAAHTFTLPSSPTIGDTIAIVDYAGTFASNKLTIARNGNNIQGVANNSQLGTNRASVTLVYVDGTKGWVYQNESNVADLGAATFITATGGTVTTSGDYKIHSFTGDGSFAVSQIGNTVTPATERDKVDYLVVAGGGGGSAYALGGGGAGGFRLGAVNSPAPPLAVPGGLTITATTYPVTVGGGGVGGTGTVSPTGAPNENGLKGSNSVFSTITSAGGGAGGNYNASPVPADLSLGGSGGAIGRDSYLSGRSSSSNGNSPPTSPSQGNPGGVNVYPTGSSASAGGGGAGAGGVNTSSCTPTAGGAGSPVTAVFGAAPQPFYIPGPNAGTFAGGGGGGHFSACNPGGANGGAGGGGRGQDPAAPVPNGGKAGGAGVVNSGGGGGGGGLLSGTPGTSPGGAGGKGIVVIRYKFQ